MTQPVRTPSSAYLMQSPPKQLTDGEAHDVVERFIKQYRRKSAKPRARSRA